MVSSLTPSPKDPEGNGSPGPAGGLNATLSFLEYFELCEKIHYAAVVDGITPLNSHVIQARCIRVDPHYLRPVSHERVYVVDLDVAYLTLPETIVQEVLATYAANAKAPTPGAARPSASSLVIASASKSSSKFCFISCAKRFLLYTSLDFVLYLVPDVERLSTIQVNDLTYLLGEIAHQGQDIPFTYELSFSLLLQTWFQLLFPDGQLSGQPDDLERSILEQFWWRTPAPEPPSSSDISKDAKDAKARNSLPKFKAATPLPSIKAPNMSKTLPHIPRVKNKDLVQETSSAYKDRLPYLLSLTWDSRRFSQPGEHGKLLAAVASWKRVQHLEAGEPIEWAEPAHAQIFRGLNSQDWKFSEMMQLRANVTPIGAKPKMQFQSTQLRGSRTLEAARFGSHGLDPVVMFGLNASVLGHLNEPGFQADHPWLGFITRFYFKELQTELYMLHYAPQLAVFQARAALSPAVAEAKLQSRTTTLRSTLSGMSDAAGTGTARPELRRDKVILYHVPPEAKFQHVALAEDVLPASILVNLLKNGGSDYRFFLVYPDLEYLEEMPVSVLIGELKGSHPGFYKQPDAIGRLASLQLPASLQPYPFQLDCSGILTPADAEAETPQGTTRLQPLARMSASQPLSSLSSSQPLSRLSSQPLSRLSSRKELQPQDDELDSLAQDAYDSDFFGYNLEKIIALWQYDAEEGEFSRIEPPFPSGDEGEEEEEEEEEGEEVEEGKEAEEVEGAEGAEGAEEAEDAEEEVEVGEAEEEGEVEVEKDFLTFYTEFEESRYDIKIEILEDNIDEFSEVDFDEEPRDISDLELERNYKILDKDEGSEEAEVKAGEGEKEGVTSEGEGDKDKGNGEEGKTEGDKDEGEGGKDEGEGGKDKGNGEEGNEESDEEDKEADVEKSYEELFEINDLPKDCLIVEIKRYEKDTRKLHSKEKLFLINLDTFRPTLILPQWFAIRSLDPETNIRCVLISPQARRIMRISAHLLWHLESEGLVNENLESVSEKLKKLDEYINTTLKPHFINLNLNLVLVPSKIQQIVSLPPEMIPGCTEQSQEANPYIEELWYLSVKWEQFWGKDDDDNDDGEGSATDLKPKVKKKETKEEHDNKGAEPAKASDEIDPESTALLKRVLDSIPEPSIEEIIENYDVTLLKLFTQFVTEALQCSLKIVDISNQFYEFFITNISEIKNHIFLINITDITQYNLFNFSPHFVEILKDPEKADEYKFFFIDGKHGKILEVKFDFFWLFFNRFRQPIDGESNYLDIIGEIYEDIGRLREKMQIPTTLTLQNSLKFIDMIIKRYPESEFIEEIQQNLLSSWQYDLETEEWTELSNEEGEE